MSSLSPMNAVSFEPTVTIDAKDSLSPIPIIKLKSAMKKQPNNAILAVETTDPHVETDLRDFCAATGHVYLCVNSMDGHTVHYIKKQTRECATCSQARIVLAGLGVIAALAFTAPQVVIGDPSAPITLVFLVALIALPPLLINNARLLGSLIHKRKT